jgi:hypothetical protein
VQLKKGVKEDKNGSVRKLQNFLYDNGYLKATPNGYFGVGTHNAVRAFQKEYGYMVTGIMGPYSVAKVNELACGSENALDKGGVTTKQAKKVAETVKKGNEKKTVSQDTVPSSQTESVVGDNASIPKISLFNIIPSEAGGQIYSAKIANVDTVSLKATCPSGVVEVKAKVGLVTTKVGSDDSVCDKEKYLLLNDANQGLLFERNQTPISFVDRDTVPSWFAFDSSSTPLSGTVSVLVKACLLTTCVQKTVSVQINSLYQNKQSQELSIGDISVTGGKTLFVKAYNFNHLTVRAGCPYTTQAVDANGTVLPLESTPCDVEKDIVADNQTALTPVYDKADGVALKDFGYVFQLKPINGVTDPYSAIELTVKACTGKEADKVTDTTIKCVEKKTTFPVTDKGTVVASSTASVK